LHFTAWQRGIKSLYYCRSKSVQRAAFAGKLDASAVTSEPTQAAPSRTDYEECLACQ
jgi:ribonucleoside-diphosphate reductase alpha chain